MAKEITKRVKTEQGFTVNEGIAHKKQMAKMASDFETKEKIHALWNEEIKTKMWTLKGDELIMV